MIGTEQPDASGETEAQRVPASPLTEPTKRQHENPPALHAVRLGIIKTRLSDGSHVFDLAIRQDKDTIRLACIDEASACKLQLILGAAIDDNTNERVKTDPDVERSA